MKLGKEAAGKITECFIAPIKLEFEKVISRYIRFIFLICFLIEKDMQGYFGQILINLIK